MQICAEDNLENDKIEPNDDICANPDPGPGLIRYSSKYWGLISDS